MSPEVISELAPTGVLRAGINLGNFLLVTGSSPTGDPVGVAPDMAREIAEMTAWKRSWMPPGAGRGTCLILHMQHYHDELLADLGISPLRKRGVFAPLKELIVPYEPSDYSAIVSGE